MTDESVSRAPSKLQPGVYIGTDGSVKIKLSEASRTPKSAINLVGAEGAKVSDKLELTITRTAFERIHAAVEGRLAGLSATDG